MQVGDKYFDTIRNISGVIKEVRLDEEAVIFTTDGEDYYCYISSFTHSDRYQSCQLRFEDMKGETYGG